MSSLLSKPVASLGVAVLLAAAQAQAQTAPPEAYVDALNAVFGKHAGAHASHAKGLCVAGSFTATGEGKAVTTAGFLQGGTTPVTGRFSVGGGNPRASDKGKSVRGLAVRFSPENGELTDLVMISTPVFFVSKAEHFIPFLEARRPDPATGKPDAAKVKAFNDSHPDTKPQAEYLGSTPVPASYGTTPYWPVSAFKLTNAEGKTVHARWRFEPRTGRLGLTEEELKTLPDDFLAQEIEQRLAKGPVEFDAWLQLASPSDNVTDPTLQWPADRPQINVGRLALQKLAPQDCDKQMFNPLTLARGIGASDDSTLHVRPAVYGVSLSRRAGH
jgi:catalase